MAKFPDVQVLVTSEIQPEIHEIVKRILAQNDAILEQNKEILSQNSLLLEKISKPLSLIKVKKDTEEQ